MIDPRHLDALAAVVEHGGFGPAAQALKLTLAAVSLRIKSLEDQLGQRLLVRGKRVRATPAAQPVVEGEGEVGAEDGDGLVRCHGAQKRDSSSHKAVPHIMSATMPSSTRHRCSEFRRRPIQKAAAPKPTNQISEPVAAPRPNTWLAGP